MDQPTAGKETFVLKTNIHCKEREEEMKKSLQNIRGVDKISIDAAQGIRIRISGDIDPKKVTEYLRKKVKNTELSWEPVVAQNDSEMIQNHQLIHDKDVEQLQILSEIKGLKTAEISRNRMKITFKEDANVQDLGGKNDYSAATSLDQQRAFHECCCSIRNQAMYMQCAICMGRMASQGNIALGIPAPLQHYPPSAPVPPSAPPVSKIYYPNSPPQQDKSYPDDYPFYTENYYPNPTPQQDKSYPDDYPFYTENHYPNPPPQQDKSYPDDYPFYTENHYPNPPLEQDKSYPDYIFDSVFGDEYQTGACSIM